MDSVLLPLVVGMAWEILLIGARRFPCRFFVRALENGLAPVDDGATVDDDDAGDDDNSGEVAVAALDDGAF